MAIREQLTSEEIRKKFKSQFDLVSYAIKLAENMVRTGRDPRVVVDSQNRAMQILEEIRNGKDKFDAIAPEAVVERREEPLKAKSVDGHAVPKRNRKAL
jgi:hypothetical protein